MMNLMKKLVLVLSLVGLLAGCANMSTTEQRTLSGAAIGTAAGAGIGILTGRPMTGAAVGAAAGAVGGYIYDRHKKSEEEEEKK